MKQNRLSEKSLDSSKSNGKYKKKNKNNDQCRCSPLNFSASLPLFLSVCLWSQFNCCPDLCVPHEFQLIRLHPLRCPYSDLKWICSAIINTEKRRMYPVRMTHCSLPKQCRYYAALYSRKYSTRARADEKHIVPICWLQQLPMHMRTNFGQAARIFLQPIHMFQLPLLLWYFLPAACVTFAAVYFAVALRLVNACTLGYIIFPLAFVTLQTFSMVICALIIHWRLPPVEALLDFCSYSYDHTCISQVATEIQIVRLLRGGMNRL